MGTQKLSPHDLEQISAYLDGELSPKHKARLEARLWSDPQWRNALDDMDRLRLGLRSLPRVRVPRNFTLPPEYARQKPVPRLYPIFGFASALAAVLLVAVLVGDLLGLGLSTATVAQPVAPLESTVIVMQEALAADMSSPTEAPAAALMLGEVPTGEVSPEASPEASPINTATVGLSSEISPTEALLQPSVTPENVLLVEADTPFPTSTEREGAMKLADTETPTLSPTPTETLTPTPSPTATTTPEPSSTPSLPASDTPTFMQKATSTPADESIPEIALLADTTPSSKATEPFKVSTPTVGQLTSRVIGDQPILTALELILALLTTLTAFVAFWNYRRHLS